MKGLLVFVLLIGFVSGSSVTCTIVDGGHAGMLPDDSRVLVEIEASDGASVILPDGYSLLEENDQRTSFISKKILKKSGGEWIFVLPRVVDSDYDLKVYLPENYILSGELVYPKNYDISSDGRSIILDWEGLSDDEVVVFYEGVKTSYFWIWFFIVFLIGFGVFYSRREKKKFSA